MPQQPVQVHNHNLSSVIFNYPCPVSQPRAVSHNRMKHRVVGPVSGIILCLSYPCRFITHPLDPKWGSEPPWGSGSRRRRFYMLRVGAPEFLTTCTKGPAVDVFNIDGRHSHIFNSTSQGARYRCFLASMVGTLKSFDSTYQWARC
jgi:hypothetical protein